LITQASVNYIQISEGLSRAFDEITELVDFSKRQVETIPTQYTRSALAKLYKEIFLYLKDCTDWFTKTSRGKETLPLHDEAIPYFHLTSVTKSHSEGIAILQ
jgi:hypothetical protein